MIITTARLSTVAVDTSLVDQESGEIPIDQLRPGTQPAVCYEYPLPPRLQFESAIVGRDGSFNDRGARLDILVVHTTALKEFLDELDSDLFDMMLRNTEPYASLPPRATARSSFTPERPPSDPRVSRT